MRFTPHALRFTPPWHPRRWSRSKMRLRELCGVPPMCYIEGFCRKERIERKDEEEQLDSISVILAFFAAEKWF